MLLDPETLDLLPAAARVRAELGDAVSLRTRAARRAGRDRLAGCATIDEAARRSRRRAARSPPASRGWARLAGAGTHPFADPEGELIDDPKYAHLIEPSSRGCSRASSCSGSTCTSPSAAPTARSPSTTRCAPTSPTLAALAGNAPLHAGRDTGLASLRPKICDLLPRQGVPPAWRSWEERADYERWGRARRRLPRRRRALVRAARATTSCGTIELRVPDAQSTRRGGGRRARVRRRAGRLARRAPRRRRAAAGPRPRPHRREPLARDAPRPRRLAARPRQRRAAARARTRASR